MTAISILGKDWCEKQIETASHFDVKFVSLRIHCLGIISQFVGIFCCKHADRC